MGNNRMDCFRFLYPIDDEEYKGEAIFTVIGCALDPGKDVMTKEELEEKMSKGETFSFEFDETTGWALLEDLVDYFKETRHDDLKKMIEQ